MEGGMWEWLAGAKGRGKWWNYVLIKITNNLLKKSSEVIHTSDGKAGRAIVYLEKCKQSLRDSGMPSLCQSWNRNCSGMFQ